MTLETLTKTDTINASAPKAAAIAVLWRDQGIKTLMVQKAKAVDGMVHRYQDCLVFPGGGLRAGESALSAALRELKEETGYQGLLSGVSLLRRGVDAYGTNIDYFAGWTDSPPTLTPDNYEVSHCYWLRPQHAINQINNSNASDSPYQTLKTLEDIHCRADIIEYKMRSTDYLLL